MLLSFLRSKCFLLFLFNLQRLHNHLQRLQGRLEVIPEEDGTESRDSLDLLQWKEGIDNEESSAHADAVS